jgi:antitoxin MazE
MKTRIVRIGNSQGIRIPKPLLEQSGLGEEVELEVRSGEITIRAASRPRAGWDEVFQAMAAEGDDALLDPDLVAGRWDEEDWTW